MPNRLLGSFSRALDRILFRTPTWAFLTGLLLVLVLKSGLWFFPNTWAIVPIAEDPFSDPFAGDAFSQYQLWTWLSPMVAFVLRATTVPAYSILHLGFALAFLGLVTWQAFRRLDDRRARIALLVFVTLPVSWISLYGIGPDGLTLLLLAVALVFPERRWLVGTCAVLLGLQHGEQIAVAALAVMAGAALDGRLGRGDLRRYLPLSAILLAGALVGRVLQVLIFQAVGMGVPAGRLEWMITHRYLLVEQWQSGWPWMIWSLLGLGWLLAGFHAAAFRRQSLSLLVPLGALLLLTPVVWDQTRVMAIVTFPLLFASWIASDGFLDRLGTRWPRWLLVAWLVTPVVFVLGGEPFGSLLGYDVQFVAHYLRGVPELPADLGMWPFGPTG